MSERIANAFRALREPREHEYTSTACQHGLHGRCRRTCKFCDAKCRCNCHAMRGFFKPWEKP